MIEYIIKGIVLGLSAGFSPGPLSALVISETLTHNSKAGYRVALAPFITDAPIVLFCFFVLKKMSHISVLLGIVSLAGALYITWLGISSFRIKPYSQEKLKNVKPRSLAKGVLVNFLSPNPYLFWLSVGSPIMIKAVGINVFLLVVFLAGFYICLVGTKLLIAFLTGKSRSFITGRAYIIINRIMGGLLILLALVLLKDGINLLYKM